MKKLFAMIAALMIALMAMSALAFAEDAFMQPAPAVFGEFVFSQATEMTDEAPVVDEAPAIETEIADLIEEEAAPTEPAAEDIPAAAEPAADFMLTYLNWDNEEILSTLVKDGETVEEMAFLIPIREGYTFHHWYDVEDEEQAAYEFGCGVGRDLALKAFFTQDPVIVVEMEEEVVEEEVEEENHVAPEMPVGDSEPVDFMDVLEHDIDGLEIVIIKDSELDAQEEAAEDVTALAEEDAVLVEDDAVLVEEDDELAEDEEDVVLIEEDEEEEDETLILEDEDEDEEELTMEDGQVPLAGPAMVAIDRKVNVRSSLGEHVNENETVTLTGELIGFDGCDLMMQWQVFDGMNWQNIEGANGMEYSFSATSESVNNSYRLAVAING